MTNDYSITLVLENNMLLTPWSWYAFQGMTYCSYKFLMFYAIHITSYHGSVELCGHWCKINVVAINNSYVSYAMITYYTAKTVIIMY